MVRCNKMILIGSTIKDAGKTTLIIEMIKKFIKTNPKTPIYGVKSTVLRGKKSPSGYSITEELNPDREKDTSKMLKAGCEKVLWLRCDEDHAEDGVKDLLTKIPKNGFMITESNTIRNYLIPDLFIMIEKDEKHEWKPTAIKIKDKADLFIKSSLKEEKLIYTPDITKIITTNESGWSLLK